MAFRLREIRDPLLGSLIEFMNGPEFKSALEERFGIDRNNRIETAVQKYLTGYEISPHPDIRSKCLTYLLNINTSEDAERLPIHTQLLKFKPRKEFIHSFWENNPDIERCWVPWDWCDSVKQMSRNNSIVLFRPQDRSLHAVKLRYDHLKFQRTQIYGNLWYTDVPTVSPRELDYTAFELDKKSRRHGFLLKVRREVARRLHLNRFRS